MQTLQHPPDPLRILLVEIMIRDIWVRLAAEAGIHPASELPLEFLDFGLEAGAALPAGEVDVAAGAGGFPAGSFAVFLPQLRLVDFAEPDQVRVVEVVGVFAHAEVVFGVLDVFFADVGSGGSVRG